MTSQARASTNGDGSVEVPDKNAIAEQASSDSVITLRLHQRSPGESFELWQDVNRPFAATKWAGRTDNIDIWDFRAHNLPNTIFTFFRNGPVEIVRGRKHLSESAGDYVVAQLFTSGSQRFILDDRAFVASAGDVVLFDIAMMHARVVDAENTDLTLLVPFDALGYRRGSHVLPRHFRSDTPQAMMISANFRGFEPHLLSGSQEAVSLFESAVLALLRTLIQPEPGFGLDSETTLQAKLEAIRRYIDDNLRSNGLDSRRLCAEFGISRAALYRAFAEHGGVSRYIMDRRLAAAYRELQQVPSTRGQIRRTAEKWGFFEPATFTRSFRRRFEELPGDAVGRFVLPDEERTTPETTLTRYHFDWMR